MLKYRVRATRTTYYEVPAPDADRAVESMMNGDAEAVDQQTEQITAVPLCPECESVCTEDDGMIYCDTCDREVSDEEDDDA